MNQEILSLRRDSAELLPLLYKGRILRHGEPWIALPREVVSGPMGVEAVVFEAIRSETLVRPSLHQIAWKLIRPETLTLTLSPSFAILTYGYCQGWSISWGTALLAVLGALFFQISVNLFNDVEDHVRLVDLLGTQGGSRVIQNGWLNAHQVKSLAYVALSLGMVFGMPAVLNRSLILFGIALAGILGVLAYSNEPFGIKYKSWGGVTVFFLGGPLLALGISEAGFAQLDWGVLTLGCFFGLAAIAVNHAGHFQNIDLDRTGGARDWVSRFGFNGARFFFPLFYGLGFIGLYGASYLGILPFILGIALSASLPWVLHFISTVYKASGPASVLLVALRRDSLRIHCILGGTTILGLLGSYWTAR